MVLSDQELWMEIGTGRLSFDPSISPEQVSPSAIDLRLGNNFTVFKEPKEGVTTILDPTKVDNIESIISGFADETTVQDGDQFILKSKSFVLAYTKEYIRLPNYLAARIEGRSSLARIGISIHQTAPTVHATFEGQLRLEILNNGMLDCALTPGMRFCQLVIERLGSPAISTLRSPFQQQRQDI
ncbi:MAG: dCTP deaminase [Chloroflexi bacterium]|nr:dCTP deaminase [Chloroflexota bacterium]